MIYIILIFLLLVVIGGINATQANKKRQQLMTLTRSSIMDLAVSQEVNGPNNFYTFIVDEKNERLAFINDSGKKLINFADIIGVELIEDGETILKKSATRTVGGAIVGGVLLGGVGAIVGGLSGSSRQKSKVSSISVKILLRSLNDPSFSINCLDSKKMFHKKQLEVNGSPYKSCKANADRIKDIVSVIIDKNDRAGGNVTEDVIHVKSTNSLSDELVKLNDLKEKGILTDAEFQMQKQKLLNN